MPHAILRALRHRSTPTLLPSGSSSTHEFPNHHSTVYPIPSIFITIPDDEGGHHWCALAGTAAPFHHARSTFPQGGDDVPPPPLPDFAALEETISKLKKAGETPVFRRPSGRKDEGVVVLPKKKYGAGQGVSHDQYVYQVEPQPEEPQQRQSGKGKRPPRPKRQSSPLVRGERVQEDDVDQDYFGATPTSEVDMLANNEHVPAAAAEQEQGGRFAPNKVFRRLSKSKKSTNRPSSVFTSVSYESVVAQPFSAPAEVESFEARARPRVQTPTKKRSSLGWFFSKRTSVVVPSQEEALEPVAEFEPYGAYSMSQVYNMAMRGEEIYGDVPMSPVETHESGLDKPLPPIPEPPSEDIDIAETIAEPTEPSDSSEASAAEMQINDSAQVQVILQAMPPQLPKMPQHTSSTAPMEKDKKIKRKFSLKRLKEKFTSTSEKDVPPPVPALPTVHLFRAGIVNMADATLPAAVPVATMPTGTSPTSSSSETKVVTVDEVMVIEAPIAPRTTLDGSSTSSEDSAASNSSTPDSSPPETPDAASDGPVFELLQSADASATVKGATKALEREAGYADDVEVRVVVVGGDGEPLAGGIPRSAGMRRQLDSLRFTEMTF